MTIFYIIFIRSIKYNPSAIDSKLANLSIYRAGIWYSGVLVTITRKCFICSCINACAYIHNYAKKETINVRSHPSYRFLAFTSSFLEESFSLRLDNVKKQKRTTTDNELTRVQQKSRAEWERRDDSVFRSTTVVSVLTNALIQRNWIKLFSTHFRHEKLFISY